MRTFEADEIVPFALTFRYLDRDIPDDAGVAIRNPAAPRRWMAAYAAASSTSASYETVRVDRR